MRATAQIHLTLALIVGVVGCAHTDVYVNPDVKAEGPRVVALDARRLPWVIEIEKRLRQRGFRVHRWGSQHATVHEAGPGRTEIFNEATTNYVIRIEGHAYLDAMNRCFGGGFEFDYVSVELIDVGRNEVLATYSGSGYSENCPPASGSIFGDIVSMVESAWP